MGWYGFRPYVTVAERRKKALKQMEKLKKKGMDIKPVCIEGKKITRTFWGEAWCDHLESFSDYENRLPRGRTYVRNGSVCHLDITPGKIHAKVSGSEIYSIDITIKPLSKNKWNQIKKSCSGQIGSLLELLSGRLSKNVMTVVTHRDNGLFPLPGEISLECSCPDWAVMCKHVAATLYGVGARLDESPELLFLLRGVDHEELITADLDMAVSAPTSGRKRIAEDALADVFGIDMTEDQTEIKLKPSSKREKIVLSKQNASATSKIQPVTGRTVAALRTKFGMSQAQFALLLGVSTASVAKWEKAPGELDLRARTLMAFNTAKKLTKSKAKQNLKSKMPVLR